jgi:hypothetical protein
MFTWYKCTGCLEGSRVEENQSVTFLGVLRVNPELNHLGTFARHDLGHRRVSVKAMIWESHDLFPAIRFDYAYHRSS